MRGGVKVYGGERPEMYRYEGGARVYVGGLDHPEKVLSGERDWIYVNQAEEVSEEDWETITTRCTGRGAQTKTPMLFGDCNPGPPDHWILKRAAAGHLQLLTSFHKDNPSLWDGQEWTEQGVKTMGTLETTTGIRRSRYLLGEWKGAEGAFFTCFDPDAHPVPAAGLALTPAMPKWIGLDWGYAHKCVAVWFAQLDTKRVGSYRELVVRGKSPEEVAVLMAELSEGERIEEVYFSPEQFAKRSDEQTVAIRLGRVLEEKGLPLPTPAVTARAQGARLCFDTLQDRTWLISRACPSLIACLPKLVTDPDNSEDVLKVDGDDEYDAARYGLMSRRGEITRSRPERITEAVEAKKIPVEDLTARHLAYLKAEHDTRREGPVHFGHRRRR
jgi:PBSX family phage terminase large subunit